MSTKRTSRPKTSSGSSWRRQGSISVAAGAWVGSKPMPAAPARASPATSASTSVRSAIPASPIPVVSRNSPPRITLRHERRLEDVHPLDPVPEPVPAGRHRDVGSEELLEAQEVADGEYRVS